MQQPLRRRRGVGSGGGSASSKGATSATADANPPHQHNEHGNAELPPSVALRIIRSQVEARTLSASLYVVLLGALALSLLVLVVASSFDNSEVDDGGLASSWSLAMVSLGLWDPKKTKGIAVYEVFTAYPVHITKKIIAKETGHDRDLMMVASDVDREVRSAIRKVSGMRNLIVSRGRRQRGRAVLEFQVWDVDFERSFMERRGDECYPRPIHDGTPLEDGFRGLVWDRYQALPSEELKKDLWIWCMLYSGEGDGYIDYNVELEGQLEDLFLGLGVRGLSYAVKFGEGDAWDEDYEEEEEYAEEAAGKAESSGDEGAVEEGKDGDGSNRRLTEELIDEAAPGDQTNVANIEESNDTENEESSDPDSLQEEEEEELDIQELDFGEAEYIATSSILLPHKIKHSNLAAWMVKLFLESTNDQLEEDYPDYIAQGLAVLIRDSTIQSRNNSMEQNWEESGENGTKEGGEEWVVLDSFCSKHDEAIERETLQRGGRIATQNDPEFKCVIFHPHRQGVASTVVEADATGAGGDEDGSGSSLRRMY